MYFKILVNSTWYKILVYKIRISMCQYNLKLNMYCVKKQLFMHGKDFEKRVFLILIACDIV